MPLRRRSTPELTVTSRATTLARLTDDPLARGALITLAGTAAVALLLALVGLVLSVVGDVRDERGELFDLEAQGASPATIRTHLRLRAALVAGFGIVGGVALGAVLSALVVSLVSVTAGAAEPEPPLQLSLDLPLLGLAAIVVRGGSRAARRARNDHARPGSLAGGGGVRMSAIELRDVFRVHSTPEGDAAALQGLSLRVADGEVLAVLGPSGSGKSTLLRLLAGLDRPSAGVVRVHGEEIGKLTSRRLAQYRATMLGYADQHYARALSPELSARELVAVQLGLRGTGGDERLRRADELLERVGLAEKRHRRPGELSGGEQQRVALCAALAHRPRVFLADEPTGELDAATADQVYDVLGELVREHDCTTVIVSHDPESARIADRIVRMRDGRVSEEWARDEDESDTIVVGRGGWLRLPEELLLRAGHRREGDGAVHRWDGRRRAKWRTCSATGVRHRPGVRHLSGARRRLGEGSHPALRLDDRLRERSSSRSAPACCTRSPGRRAPGRRRSCTSSPGSSCRTQARSR